MNLVKNKFIPIMITAAIIVVIIYLISSVEQPYVVCSKNVVDEFGVTISEKLITSLENNHIDEMELTKTIILPETLEKDNLLYEIQNSLEAAYKYLDSDDVDIIRSTDRIIVEIEVDDYETIMLGNIKFIKDGNLTIKINPNTKSSDVVTLSVNDRFTEGEFMSQMKKYGYSCK